MKVFQTADSGLCMGRSNARDGNKYDIRTETKTATAAIFDIEI